MKLLIDCGPDTLQELRRHTQLSAIDGIVISHCHSDHILDLVTLRYALVYSMDKPEARIPLWTPPGGVAILEALGKALGSQGEAAGDFWREVYDLREYDPTCALKIGALELDFASTQHFTPCFAIRIRTTDGATVVYGADTGRIGSLVDFAASAALLIAEATADSHAGVAPDDRGHLIPEDAGDWAARSRVGRLLLTHLWAERAPGEVVARAATRFDGPIDVARPGLTIYV